MSKQYYGYVFKKNYSMYEIQKIMKEFQEIAVKFIEIKLLQLAIRDFTYYYNCVKFKEIFGDKNIDVFDGKNIHVQKVLKNISDGNYKDALKLTLSIDYFKAKKQAKYTDSDIEYEFDYNFNNQFYLFPYSNGKTYAMFFGDGLIIEKEILKKGFLKDYSFQNSADRPKNISESEYKKREKVWDDLLCPTYIPMKEGFCFDLTNNEILSRVYFTKDNVENLVMPFEKEIVGMLVDSFVDYPSKECYKDGFDWIQYIKTSEYRDWKNFNIERTKSNLKMFDLDEVKHILNF